MTNHSERARELLAAEYEAQGQHEFAAGLRRGDVHEDMHAPLSAVERAIASTEATARAAAIEEAARVVDANAEACIPDGVVARILRSNAAAIRSLSPAPAQRNTQLHPGEHEGENDMQTDDSGPGIPPTPPPPPPPPGPGTPPPPPPPPPREADGD